MSNANFDENFNFQHFLIILILFWVVIKKWFRPFRTDYKWVFKLSYVIFISFSSKSIFEFSPPELIDL